MLLGAYDPINSLFTVIKERLKTPIFKENWFEKKVWKKVFKWSKSGTIVNDRADFSLTVFNFCQIPDLVISKYINFDKKLPKTPILWNFWLKNDFYSNTVHVTVFHGMLLQKRKQFLDIFSFQYGAISIKKKENIQCYLWQKSKQNSPKTFHLQWNLAFLKKVTPRDLTEIEYGESDIWFPVKKIFCSARNPCFRYPIRH